MDVDVDGITRVRARMTEWPSSVGNVRIVSDEGKEWMAREALRERWLEGSICTCTLANDAGLREKRCASMKFL